MENLKKILCYLQTAYSRSATFIGIFSFIFAILIAAWPNIFNIEKNIIDKAGYASAKQNLSSDSINYLSSFKDGVIPDIKLYIKSIPSTISQNEKNIIIDLIKNPYDYSSLNNTIVLVILILSLGSFFYREVVGGRKYRIAHSIKNLHKSIHIIRDNWQEIFPESDGKKDLSIDNAKKYIQLSIDEFEKYISIVSGTPCRVCIKVIIDFNSLQVETFARSSSSLCINTNKDSSNDTIENNTDFKALFSSKHRFWHVPNVDTATNYQNSHLNITSHEKKSKQLGYKTSFTWPIRKVLPKTTSSEDDIEIYGFLCVDSRVSNIFSEQYDFDSGALVADFYYFLLRAYFIIANQKVKEADNAKTSPAKRGKKK